MLSESFLRAAAEMTREGAKRQELGRVTGVTGSLLEAHLPGAEVGALVEVSRRAERILGEVVGLRGGLALIVPFGEVHGVSAGAHVRKVSDRPGLMVSSALLGRVIDPFGRPLDGGKAQHTGTWMPLDKAAPEPTKRGPINERFDTGLRVVDGLLACGRGQRVGLFAGAGVGKTTLMRQISQQSKADVVVFGLIGERGCEVQDLMEDGVHDRAVVVAATSDRTPIERARGAQAATSVAEYFRDQGAHVLLVLDSLTRYAMALREIGLAAGEPPATKGYPPSVFAALPRLLERAAPLHKGGSITGFYTVLVEGDDLSDPVADAARSLLDGHIVLSRGTAARGVFPAIDVLASASRVAHKVTPPTAQALAQKARSLLSSRREAEELRSLGAYVAGANPVYDRALAAGVRLEQWARQSAKESSPYDQSMRTLGQILDPIKGADL